MEGGQFVEVMHSVILQHSEPYSKVESTQL